MRTLLVVMILVATNSVAAQDCGSLPWEANLTYQLNSGSSVGWRDASLVVSDAAKPLAIAVPLGFYAIGLMRLSDDPATNRYTAETGLQTGVAIAVSGGLGLLLKELFERPRPFVEHPDCITPYDGSRGFSMPSGHSTAAAALAASMIFRYPEWYVIVPSVAYALYTGISRMHLGMHYLSDVIAGYVLGAGIAWAVNALNQQLFDLADPLLPSVTTSVSALVGPSHIPLVSVSYSL